MSKDRSALSEPIEQWWDGSWMRYSLEQLAEHDMIPTEEIEAFTYETPFPTDGPVPCDICRGQGCEIEKVYETDEGYRVSWCYACGGTTEKLFLCSGCGAEAYVENARLTKDLPDQIVQHAQWCMLNDRCMTMISAGARTCCRPIVARFDVQADGRMWGYCGVHSRGKQDDEERAARWALDRLQDEWKQSEREQREATVDERLTAIKAKLGIPEEVALEHRIRYDGACTVTVPLEILEQYVGAPTPRQENDLESLIGFEAGDGPESF